MSEAATERPRPQIESVKQFGQTILSPKDIQSLKGKVTETLKSEEPDSKYWAVDQLSYLKRVGLKVGVSEKLRGQLQVERTTLKNDPHKLAKYLVRLNYLGVIKKEDVTDDEKALVATQIEQSAQDPDAKNFAEMCVSAKGVGVEIPPAAQAKILSEITTLSQQPSGSNVDRYVKRLAQARYLGIEANANLASVQQLTEQRLTNHQQKEDWIRFARLQALYTRATDKGFRIDESTKSKLVDHAATIKDNPADIGRYLRNLKVIEQSLSEISVTYTEAFLLEFSLDLETEPVQEKESFLFQYLPDPEQRKMLAERVMDLVYETRDKSYDTVIFLDKSARPLSILFRDLWRKRFNTNHPPTINFINIGKETIHFIEKRLAHTHPEVFLNDSEADEDELGIFDSDEFNRRFDPQETLNLFNPAEVERIRNQYPDLQKANRTIIIDELSVSGATLVVAQKIVRGLFPNIQMLHARALRGDSSFDPLFHDHDEKHINSPWRNLYKTDTDRRGVTGVIDKDNKIPSFTTQPSARNNPELIKKIRQLREEMHAVADEYWISYGQNKTHADIKKDIIHSQDI